MPKKKQGYDFEQTLSELEKLVESMERGDLSLEDSLESFEQGIKLTRECQTKLNQAEQKVHQLIETNGAIKAELFESEQS